MGFYHIFQKATDLIFTLMRNSRGNQSATKEIRELFFFGEDGSLVLTFNGAKHQVKYNELEVIQFNSNSSEFEFYSINFPEGPGETKFTEKNPPECLECHGLPPRPIWEPYPIWPGAFGEEEDSVGKGSEEKAAIEAFVANYMKRDRYRYLVNVKEHYGKYMVEYPSRVRKGAWMLSFGQNPNAAFTSLLFKHNIKRIAKTLYNQKTFERNKFLAASILSGCGLFGYSGDNKYSPEVSLLSEEFDLIEKRDSRLTTLRKTVAQIDPVKLGKGSSLHTLLQTAAGRLKYANDLLKLGIDIDLKNWSTSFTGTSPTQMIPQFVPDFHTGTIDLSSLIVATSFEDLDPDFSGLKNFVCEVTNSASILNGAPVKLQSFCENGHSAVCKAIGERWLKSMQ